MRRRWALRCAVKSSGQVAAWLGGAVLAALSGWSAGRVEAAERWPYGHPDFYPSAEQPAELRGDSATGQFPAATPVTKWDFRTGANIVWGCRLPGWGYSSPIVVGDKAFVTCDWNKLICVDVRTGKIAWVKTNETYDIVGDKNHELRALFDKVTGDWLTAWQCCWEIAYLTWKLDVVKAAKAGQKFEFPKGGGYGHAGRAAKGGGNIAPDHVTDAQMEAVAARAKALSDAEVKAMEERLAQLQKKREASYWGPNVSAYVPRLSPYQRGSPPESDYKQQIGEAFKKLTPKGLFTDFWNGYLAVSFPTPVSDGENVYAMWSQCQVVCYDLEGNRRWIKVFTEDAVSARLDQNYSASPLLADDKLIVIFGGHESVGSGGGSWTRVRALDPKTGQTLWSRKLTYVVSSHSFPQIARVKHGGIDAIATSAGAILRTADGEPIIENLPTSIAPPLVHENEVFITCGSGESTGGGSRMKVVLTGSGKDIRANIAWGFLPDKHKSVAWFSVVKKNFPDAPLQEFPYGKAVRTDVGCVWDEGRLIYGDGPWSMVDAQSGKELSSAVKTKYEGKGGRGHLVRAGNVLITTCCGTVVRVHDLKDPTKVVGIGHVGSKYHQEIQLWEMSGDEAVKAIRELPWLPCMADWCTMQTTPWPQGDRLYIRAKDTLWCIGEPKQPYHSPAGAPAQARTDGVK